MSTVKAANRQHGPLILVADVDGAFARGAADDAERLYEVLRDRRHSALIYVTRRAIHAARAYQNVMGLPRPDVFVAERGSSVAPGYGDAPIAYVDRELDKRWPGIAAVRKDLEVLGAYMDEVPNTGQRRLAYIPPDGMPPSELADVMASALDKLDVDVVQTGDGTVDVVPKNVTSGFTLDRVLEWIEADPEWVVVAADTLRHADLFRPGRRGIVVASADEGLRHRLAQRPEIYMAERDGAAGLLDGLKHFGFVASKAATNSPSPAQAHKEPVRQCGSSRLGQEPSACTSGSAAVKAAVSAVRCALCLTGRGPNRSRSTPGSSNIRKV
jgi:hydroxymethylpyrimidine pyrophosphatase-like HAD family hydrolase